MCHVTVLEEMNGSQGMNRVVVGEWDMIRWHTTRRS
jgi:hypothetical protein